MADIAKQTVSRLKELFKSKLYSDTILEIHEYDDGSVDSALSVPVFESNRSVSSMADLAVDNTEAGIEVKRKKRKRSRWSNTQSPTKETSSEEDGAVSASNNNEINATVPTEQLSALNDNEVNAVELTANEYIVVDEDEKGETNASPNREERNEDEPADKTSMDNTDSANKEAAQMEEAPDAAASVNETLSANQTSAAISTASEHNSSDQGDTEFECSSLFASLKLHSLVLHLHSPRFRQLLRLRERDVHVSVIHAEVRKGFGQYLEILVSSFYDPEVLDGLSLTQLLGVLEVAKTYGSEVYVKRCCTLLHEMKVDNYPQCELVLTQIANLESTSSSSEFLKKLEDQCVSLIAQQFGPLERNADEHERFLGMRFTSLKCLVRSKMRFALSENSIVTFIVEWLEQDEMRQTANQIGELLSAIKIRFLTIDFLCDVITPAHPILCKWDGFKDWYLAATTFHALSSKLKNLKFPAQQNESNRNFVLLDQTLINATAWLIRMTEQEAGKFYPVPMLTTSNGYKIRPVHFRFKQVEGVVQGRYDVILSMTSSGTIPHCRMFFAVLPYNKKYEKLTINLGTLPMEVVQATTINFEVQNGIYEIKVGWSSQEFMNTAKENGFYFVMLIVLDEEYEAWAKLSFACPCNHGVMHINGCCRKCGYSYFGKKDF